MRHVAHRGLRRSANGLVTLANHVELLVMVFVGNVMAFTTLFWVFEDVTWWKSFYGATITTFTIGYGDVLPTTIGSYALTTYYVWSAWILLLLVSAAVITKLIRDNDKFTHEEQEALKRDLATTRGELSALRDQLSSNMFSHDEQEVLKAALAETRAALEVTNSTVANLAGHMFTDGEQTSVLETLRRIETAVANN